MTTLLARVASPAVRPSHRVRHLLEHNLIVYRSVWWVILAGFFEPVPIAAWLCTAACSLRAIAHLQPGISLTWSTACRSVSAP